MKEGAALCPTCGALWRLADLLDAGDAPEVAFSNPPVGCAIHDLGNLMVVRASLRSIPKSLGALGFAAFWNSIVSVFVCGAIASIYTHLIGPLPSWFPSPMGIAQNLMPLSMAIPLCIFLLPFIAIGIGAMGAVLLLLFGRTEVVLAGTRGAVRTGIGPLVWTRRFDTQSITRITDDHVSHHVNDEPRHALSLVGDRTINFGSMLTEQRRSWMRSVLYTLIIAARR